MLELILGFGAYSSFSTTKAQGEKLQRAYSKTTWEAPAWCALQWRSCLAGIWQPVMAYQEGLVYEEGWIKMFLVHGSSPNFIHWMPAAGWDVKSLVNIKLLVFSLQKQGACWLHSGFLKLVCISSPALLESAVSQSNILKRPFNPRFLPFAD